MSFKSGVKGPAEIKRNNSVSQILQRISRIQYSFYTDSVFLFVKSISKRCLLLSVDFIIIFACETWRVVTRRARDLNINEDIVAQYSSLISNIKLA